MTEHNKQTQSPFKKSLTKYIGLFALGTLTGILLFEAMPSNTHPEDTPIFNIDQTVYTASETMDGLKHFDEASTKDFVRNYAIFEALNDEYGSEYVDERVIDVELSLYEQRGIDPEDPTGYYQLGYASRGAMMNDLRLNILIDRYLEETVSGEEVESYYESWQPTLSVIVAPADQVENADQMLEEWSKVEEKDSTALYRFLDDYDLQMEAVAVPHDQVLFNDHYYEVLLDLDEYDGAIVQSRNVQGDVLAFVVDKPLKTDFETDKEVVRRDQISAMKRNDVQFINQLMEDLGIQSTDYMDLTYQ